MEARPGRDGHLLQPRLEVPLGLLAHVKALCLFPLPLANTNTAKHFLSNCRGNMTTERLQVFLAPPLSLLVLAPSASPGRNKHYLER